MQNSSLSYAIQGRRVHRLAGLGDFPLRKKIIVLKIKITIHYINEITSPVNLILPSLASSLRIRFKSASLIPAHHLSLLLYIRSPLLVRIHKERSLGNYNGSFLIISRFATIGGLGLLL
jgi:hypothetical protein